MGKVVAFMVVLALACFTSVQGAEPPALGITMSTAARPSGGVEVTGVVPSSPAAQIGLQPGDVILTVNGQQVSDYRQVIRHVAASEPGAQMRLEILRGDWRATRIAYLGRHQQVFQAEPIFQATTVTPSAPTVMGNAPWRQSLQPMPPYRTSPRDDLIDSLYNSDF